MSSIDSMETLADDSSSSQQKPYVFVVGTHRDVLEKQLGREGARARIAEIDEEFLSLVREHKYEGPGGDGQSRQGAAHVCSGQHSSGRQSLWSVAISSQALCGVERRVQRQVPSEFPAGKSGATAVQGALCGSGEVHPGRQSIRNSERGRGPLDPLSAVQDWTDSLLPHPWSGRGPHEGPPSPLRSGLSPPHSEFPHRGWPCLGAL